jgi:hypothetical protein
MITSPADERLLTTQEAAPQVEVRRMAVRVKAWSDRTLLRGYAAIGDQKVDLEQLPDSPVWQAILNTDRLPDGISLLTAHFTDEGGKSAQDTLRVVIHRSSSRYKSATRIAGDKENAIGAWPEHGILGTQLGPNKNGRKW